MFKDKDNSHSGLQLLIYGYLFMHRDMRDEVNLSLEELIRGCGYSVNRHSGKANKLFLDNLHYIVQQNKSGHFNIKYKHHKKQINLTDRIILYLGEIIIDDEKYTKLPFDDFDIIVNSECKNKDNLILMYLYLKSHFFERKKIKDNYGNIIGEEGNPRDNPVGYAIDYDHIAYDTGLSKSTVIRVTDTLHSLKLIYNHTTGGYNDIKGKIKNAPNIYTLWKYQDEIEYVINKLKEVYKVDRFFALLNKKEKEVDKQ